MLTAGGPLLHCSYLVLDEDIGNPRPPNLFPNQNGHSIFMNSLD